ncbi:MAG: hypothetical protein EA422_10510 [Gemmatimonadales bacterium]|nr:MAG: hypothetical protein EA422_10510 [Gemmatimonadales bacterium]
MRAIPNLWHLLNLASSPFFQDRLTPVGDPAHPIELFVGRGAEAELLLRTIGSSDGSRQAIPGAVGRGKTTLAQYVKSELGQARYLAANDPVSVGSADTAAELLVRILSAAYQTVLTHGDSTTGGLEPMKVARQLLRAFQTQGGSISLGLSGIGSIGAGISRAFVTSPAALSALAPELLREIGLVAQDHIGAKGLIIHLNNLENLSEANADRAARVMRDLRDTALLVPGIHYLLVGADEAVRSVVQSQPQLRSVFRVLPPLAPLSNSDLLELLQRRYEHLRLAPERPVHPPATEEAVLDVYSLFRGDLRGTFGALEQAAVRLIGVAGELPTDPMDRDPVRSVLHGVYADEIDSALGQVDVEFLQRLAQTFAGQAFTQAEVEAQTQVPLTTISDAFGRLVPQGFILVLGKRAATGPGRRPVEYSLSGAVHLAFAERAHP